jgi:hypothetical protein
MAGRPRKARFFDPARALLQRHETVISAEVRRIGPALVFERLWEEEIGWRTAIEQLVAVAGNTQLPFVVLQGLACSVIFVGYMYASIAAGRAE